MPELPDLEIVREVLALRLAGQAITSVEVLRPLVVRDLTGQGFAEALVGQTFAGPQRRGKILLLPLAGCRREKFFCKNASLRLVIWPATHRRE